MIEWDGRDVSGAVLISFIELIPYLSEFDARNIPRITKR